MNLLKRVISRLVRIWSTFFWTNYLMKVFCSWTTSYPGAAEDPLPFALLKLVRMYLFMIFWYS